MFGFSESGRSAKIAFHTFKEDKVSVITSDFNHRKKSYYDGTEKFSSVIPQFLHVLPYKRNLSVKRLISHLSFAHALKKYLNSLSEVPDLVYCAMPASSGAYIAGKYCKKHNIPFVIDVIDLWPDSLIPIVPFKRIINICLFPWRHITKKAYRLASYISGESKKYSDIAHKENLNVPYSYTYIGVESNKVELLLDSSSIILNKPKDEIWIGYGGSLGQSYDFDIILQGMKYLTQQGVKYKMWFIGDGEKADYIRTYSQANGLNFEITGHLEYKDLLKYLSYCDIAINSFKPDTLVVHSYKFNDYVATGCYILNNLSGETSDMIDEYGVGRNFDKDSFCTVLLETVKNMDNLKLTIKDNLNKLKQDKLETSLIYSSLKKDICEKLAIDN